MMCRERGAEYMEPRGFGAEYSGLRTGTRRVTDETRDAEDWDAEHDAPRTTILPPRPPTLGSLYGAHRSKIILRNPPIQYAKRIALSPGYSAQRIEYVAPSTTHP